MFPSWVLSSTPACDPTPAPSRTTTSPDGMESQMGWCLSRLFVIELVDKIRFLPVRAFERMIWIRAGRDLPARGATPQPGRPRTLRGGAGARRCRRVPVPHPGHRLGQRLEIHQLEPFRWCEQEKPASPTEAAARERFGEFEAKWATKYPGDRPALAQRPFP